VREVHQEKKTKKSTMMVNLSNSTAETPAQALETHASKRHGNTTMGMKRVETPAQAVETDARHRNTTTIQHGRQEEDQKRRPKSPRWLFPPPRTHDRQGPLRRTQEEARQGASLVSLLGEGNISSIRDLSFLELSFSLVHGSFLLNDLTRDGNYRTDNAVLLF
jgi:hypothetical protein